MLFMVLFLFFFFFFSSRRRHTRYIGDWSSDVCSSDLRRFAFCPHRLSRAASVGAKCKSAIIPATRRLRSEERRVGKEGRSGRSPARYKKRRASEESGAMWM